MSTFKELKSNLQPEYSYNWKLIKEKDISHKQLQAEPSLDFLDKINNKTTKPRCQNIDLIVPSKKRTRSQQIQLEQFLNIIGSQLHDDTMSTSLSRHSNEDIRQETENDNRQFERNDEKRQFRIQEFIKTEKSYVETLKTLVKYVVSPLKYNMQQKNCVLNTFKCHKIFLNIEQILSVNEKFLQDLQNNSEFGLVCRQHIINFECYRKYLLEQSEAQKLHAKEFKTNQVYKRFLSRVKDQSEFKRKRLQDILVEPVQRISRYSMMLREILQLTPEEHSDFRGLKIACEKAKEIATMADDDPTKTATMFLNLYQAIKDSPCSLINQKRSLVAHLDATEIHRVTNKPTRAVSLFLFTDKILVASRSCIDAKEIDLEELLDNTATTTSTSLFNKNEKALKFKGWADIESIELFDGISDSTFILTATNVQETKKNEMSNITSFENYFYKGPRLFSVIAQTRLKNSNFLEKVNEFKNVYQKTRALVKQYEVQDKTYYRVWKGVPTFCNVYNPDSYVSAKYKNDSAIIYVDDDIIDTEKLFARSSYLYNPWIIGLIQPENMKGFRFNICTRMNFTRSSINKSNDLTIDFESIFWNNMLFLDQSLKRSVEFAAHSMLKIQQATNSNNSRPRSISRSSSIPSIGKLFHNNNDNIPTKNIIKQTQKRVPVHHSWSSNNSGICEN
ncbi:hypothetical protein INT48_006165 [Thamnidium elegans]|uniref:DH domain-containing protein n=1 Tax=Thamnidium elegans TaxID=101142 RepID=A0A8H7VSD7_9FUNG|nr:hypothetical protein INT48_006165 [Thamnidium elegans]